ncbi:MAG: phytanoyl-CoA dioxygenase [Alphaproteobacteria bacterium]|nr:phytanoyl-CoA dioxygenase [Alphaproteobacteria bacterium]
MTTTVDATHIEAFARDGAVALRGVFAPWVESLRAGIDRNLAAPGPDVRIYRNADGTGLFFGDYCNWDRIPEFRDFLFHSPVGAVAAGLMGSRTARVFHEHVLVKEPGTDIPTPWHHDQPYYAVDGRMSCSLWVALDPVPRATAVEYVAGSHAWGRWFRPERFNRTPLYADDGLEAVPDIDAERERYRILSWDLAPGDAVAFHFLTLHGAPGNPSAVTRRRAFSARFVGDDATYAVRAGPTSPPFRDVRLAPGDPLAGPEFPVVFEPG